LPFSCQISALTLWSVRVCKRKAWGEYSRAPFPPQPISQLPSGAAPKRSSPASTDTLPSRLNRTTPSALEAVNSPLSGAKPRFLYSPANSAEKVIPLLEE